MNSTTGQFAGVPDLKTGIYVVYFDSAQMHEIDASTGDFVCEFVETATFHFLHRYDVRGSQMIIF